MERFSECFPSFCEFGGIGWRWCLFRWWALDRLARIRFYLILKEVDRDKMSRIDSMIEKTTTGQ